MAGNTGGNGAYASSETVMYFYAIPKPALTHGKTTMYHFLQRWTAHPERRQLYRWSFAFFFFISLLSIGLGLRYLVLYSLPREPLGLLYTFCAFFGHFTLIGLLPWALIALPLVTFFPLRALVFPCCILAGALVLTALLLDGLVFAEDRFHLNTLTIAVLGWKTWGFGILYLVIILVFLSFLSPWIRQRFVVRSQKLPARWIGAVTILLVLVTHGMHIWAEATYYTPITRFTTFLPAFFPATARRLMLKHGLVDVDKVNEKQIVSRLPQTHRDDLAYPLKPLRFSAPAQPLNIVFIIIDALRASVMNDAVVPRLCALADSNISFENHYSGGNSSRMGLFTLFYGLPSTYQQVFENYRRSPALIDAALDCGYEVAAFNSSPFYKPANLDGTVFSRIPSSHLTWHGPGKPMYVRDSLITGQWHAWLDSRNDTVPFFGLLFYTGPHAFSFPPSYEAALNIPSSATALEKKFARYCAAARYNDSLVGAVIQDLRCRNLLPRTVILITADHGEEFNENGLGFKGHGSAFSDEQIHVPLIAIWPDRPASRFTHRTSHYDVAPSLLGDIFGCVNPPSDFCSGKNLFDDRSWEWLIVGSYYNFAVLEPEQVTIQFPGGYFEVRDRSYRIIKKPRLNLPALNRAFQETGRFFRK